MFADEMRFAHRSEGWRVEKAAEREFLRELKAKSPMLDVRPYEEWMGSRTHRKLL